LDGESVTVIGVMAAGFHDRMLWGPVDVWRPIAFTDDQRQNRGNNFLQSVARLKSGVSIAQAQAEMDAIAVRLARDYPLNNTEKGLRLLPLAESGMDDTVRHLVWLTTGLTGFVLLIACANLANLQFARTANRAHELAIRTSLGAPRGRLLRQLLTESLLISFLGGLLGLVVAGWANAWIGPQIVVGDETGLALPLNLKMIGFALLISTLSGLAFGLVPAWRASRADVNDSLKQGSRGTTDDRVQLRVSYGLIVAEVALALVLLAGAGMFVRGLDRFTFRDPGWRVDGLTIGYLSLPESKYGVAGARLAFTERLQERLATLPGVERAAFGLSLPIWGTSFSGGFAIEGRPEPPRGREPLGSVNAVTPGYFETLGIRLVAGRGFTTTDTTNRPAVVIINEMMARTFWPGESPLGKRIGGPDDWRQIVGVVSDVRFAGNLSEPDTRFQTYRPFAQEPRGPMAVALRGNVPVATFQRAVAELDPDLPVSEPGPARAAVGRILANYALTGWLLGGFALLGVLLAGLGIYGVIAGYVVQRTSEIGVRIALGAQLRDVLWLVLAKGLRLTLLGAAIGLVGALGVARLLAAAAPELSSNDPLIIVSVTTLLIGVALFACWLPARRAAKVDPMLALRYE
jgi:putative ABC transport system permease protein